MKHIYISSGEASGDLLGADLAQHLLQKDPTLKLTGMGGEKMRAAGVDIIFDGHALSIIGIIEIFFSLPKILWTWFQIKHYLKREKPSVIIFIDFPDTHFRLLKTAKKIGAKIHYYVSPQIWAWRYHRIHTLKKYIDCMAVLFSFEEKIYRDAGIPVIFVGHPLGKMANTCNTAKPVDKNTVALFPGSRRGELQHHLPIMIKAAAFITKQKPEMQFVLVLADHFDPTKIQLPEAIHVISKQQFDLSEEKPAAAIAASGTVTLEIALEKIPFCVIYVLNPMSYWIVKQFIRIKQFSLCNIVCQKTVVKEFIQKDAHPVIIAQETIQLLNNAPYRENMIDSFSTLPKALNHPKGFKQWIDDIVS